MPHSTLAMPELLTVKHLHPLVANKLKLLPDALQQNPEIVSFIQSLNETLETHEREKELIEHAHRISSMEFTEVNRKLRELSDRLRLATKAAQIGVWEWNSFTGSILWDDFMYEIFGVSNRETFGKISSNWHKLIHPDDQKHVANKLANITAPTQEGKLEFKIIREGDGAVRHVYMSVLVNYDAKMSPLSLVGVCMDVTDIKNTEKENAELLSSVIKQNKELEDFAFVISHRLRSHSSKLSSVASVFSNPAADEKLRNTLIEEVEKESKLLDETLRELSDAVGLGTVATLPTEALNLKMHIDKVVSSITQDVKPEGVNITVKLAESTTVLGIKSYLENVLQQLIGNAIKFRKAEDVTEIIIESVETQKVVKLFIADNGIGIDMERHQSKLFGLYRKFHTHIEGKGIGLHMVKKQTELMGGTIEIFSELNTGTTVTLTLKKA